MFRGQIRRNSAALALAGIVTAGLAIGTASAQTPPLALQKFALGQVAPIAIATGADGNLYVTGNIATVNGTTMMIPSINIVSPLGGTNLIKVPFMGAVVGTLTSGPDGNIWYVDTGNKAIGKLVINGDLLEEFTFSNLTPADLTAAPDNTL
jgi:streptogramin lyase